jgi:hypothetical protein
MNQEHKKFLLPRCVFQEIKSGFNLVTSPREGSTGRESSVSVISLCISVYLGAFREDQTWQLDADGTSF